MGHNISNLFFCLGNGKQIHNYKQMAYIQIEYSIFSIAITLLYIFKPFIDGRLTASHVFNWIPSTTVCTLNLFIDIMIHPYQLQP